MKIINYYFCAMEEELYDEFGNYIGPDIDDGEPDIEDSNEDEQISNRS
jgi:hypothetical protein